MMFAADELLSFFVRSRADTALLVLGAIGACLICRRHMGRRRSAHHFAPVTYVTVLLFALLGGLVAEWARRVIGHSASVPAAALLALRATALGGAALLGAVVLVAAARLALLREEIRKHAETERQLQQAKTAADEANRAKGDFLAVMSHEIRTPLNAVMGFANLLSETRVDEAQRGYIATITSEGARLGALINDILDLTKIDEGRLVIERLPFAPVETAHEVLRLLSARALEKKIDLRFEAQIAGPLLVAGDPLRFRQILVNLIDNAIKFTSNGSVTLYLAWSPPDGALPHGQLGVRVRDTGIGIAANKVKDLFQMFMQADTSTTRRFGGTGLGLAICQRLVRLMGSEITVQSARGEGSEFAFVLPLAPVALPARESASGPELAMPPLQSPRILVVDDMETNRFLLEVFLRRNGFEPALAATGEEAVRLAAENAYEAILMDLQMPGIDGYTATRRIRESETNGRRTPIIALTATINKGTREKCLAAGMDEHLTKPLDLRRFKALLTTFIMSATPAEERQTALPHIQAASG